MSADNWAKCPRCAIKRDDDVAALSADLDAAYGVVPVEEFDRLRAERDTLAATELKATFRADYEIWGVEDGEFHVSYSGGCSVCKLKHEFRHSETLEVSP